MSTKKTYETYRQKSGTGLTRNGRDVLRVLSRSKMDCLTVTEITARSECCLRTVKRCLTELEHRGDISVHRCSGQPNEYKIIRGGK